MSNYRFSDEPIKATGTWLRVMGLALSSQETIQIINVTHAKLKEPITEEIFGIKQFIIPSPRSFSNKLPANSIINHVNEIIDKVKPDLIHIWGTEFFWGTLTIYIKDEYKILLEIQGLTIQIKDQFYGGLTPFEILQAIGIKELLRYQTNPFYQYFILKKSAETEKEIISNQKFISVQSAWSKSIVSSINSKAKLFDSLIPLREEFLNNAGSWCYQNKQTIFVSASSPHLFKGLHVILRALNVLKSIGFEYTLRIGGSLIGGILEAGYISWLKKEINKNSLTDNVVWLGPLDGEEIVKELKNADVCVIPSYIESYCLALYESICIGTPVVCSYAGAMPEAIKYNHNLKFFQPGDYYLCAKCVIDCINEVLFFKTDLNSFVTTNDALNRQLEIYENILS